MSTFGAPLKVSAPLPATNPKSATGWAVRQLTIIMIRFRCWTDSGDPIQVNLINRADEFKIYSHVPLEAPYYGLWSAMIERNVIANKSIPQRLYNIIATSDFVARFGTWLCARLCRLLGYLLRYVLVYVLGYQCARLLLLLILFLSNLWNLKQYPPCQYWIVRHLRHFSHKTCQPMKLN